MTWAGALLIAVISVALGWLFARQGLEGVSWAAGIIGTLVTIITAVLGEIHHRQSQAASQANSPQASTGGQHVNANVQGRVTMVRGADGNVKITSPSPSHGPSLQPPAQPANLPDAHPDTSGQTVQGSVGESVHLIDGAKGDLEIN